MTILKAPLLALLVPILSSFLFSAPSQLSESEKSDLRGLKRVRVVVENLHEDAAKCNLQKEGLALQVARPLVDAGLWTEENVGTFLYVNVSVFQTSSGLCVAAYGVQLKTYALAKLEYQDTPGLVVALLSDEGGSMSGPAYGFGDRIEAAVRTEVDRLVTKIKLANAK